MKDNEMKRSEDAFRTMKDNEMKRSEEAFRRWIFEEDPIRCERFHAAAQLHIHAMSQRFKKHCLQRAQ